MMYEEEKLGTADLMDLRDTKYLSQDTRFNWDTRPDWDSWFMTLCYVIAQRSLDRDTKCGCVIVSLSRSILSVGYNGPPRGCDDSKIPLTRPLKYNFMEHSESNAIINAAREGIPLKGSIFYITGPPCHDCFRKILNVGAVKIVQGPGVHSTVEKEKAIIATMREGQDIEIVTYRGIGDIYQVLFNTKNYMDKKLGRTS